MTDTAPGTAAPPQPIDPASPASPKPSYLYQLVQKGLGSDVLAFIRERREQDPPQPFYVISAELSQAANVGVTYETCRRWFRAAYPDADTND